MGRAPSRFRFDIRAIMLATAMVGVAIVATRYVRDARETHRRAALLGYGHGRAILVADGEVVLIRQGNAYGAIRFDRQTIGEHADFAWRYRDDGKGSLNATDPAVQEGSGHTSTYGGTVVRFGPFAIEWSGCANGYGWLYHHQAGPPYRLCATSSRSFERMDAADVKWQYVDRPIADLPDYPHGLGQ